MEWDARTAAQIELLPGLRSRLIGARPCFDAHDHYFRNASNLCGNALSLNMPCPPRQRALDEQCGAAADPAEHPFMEPKR